MQQNEKIFGNLSEKMREIDVAIRSNVAGETLLIAIECRRRGRASDVEQIEGFSSKIKDIGANKASW